MNWLGDKLHSSNFAVLIELEGEITVGRLDVALNETARRHPMLHVTTQPDARGVVRFAKAPKIPITTTLHDIPSETGWLVPMQKILDRPFPTGAFPLVASSLLGWMAGGASG